MGFDLLDWLLVASILDSIYVYGKKLCRVKEEQ
jgi:hypothetical protein